MCVCKQGEQSRTKQQKTRPNWCWRVRFLTSSFFRCSRGYIHDTVCVSVFALHCWLLVQSYNRTQSLMSDIIVVLAISHASAMSALAPGFPSVSYDDTAPHTIQCHNPQWKTPSIPPHTHLQMVLKVNGLKAPKRKPGLSFVQSRSPMCLPLLRPPPTMLLPPPSPLQLHGARHLERAQALLQWAHFGDTAAALRGPARAALRV